MQDISETAITKQYKIRIKFFSFLFIKILVYVNSILIFFGLKKTKRFWGIVYDSFSKQPLDPVIVKLLYSDGREIETCVTDIMGRYAFLASPGKFKIFARKTNYIFPSTHIKGDADGIYENIYKGEFFSLTDDLEVVAPNIPMDPVNFDWNQQAKKKLDQSYPYTKLLFRRLVKVFFWFFLIFTLVEIWKTYPAIEIYNYCILILYLVLLLTSKLLPEAKLYGRVKLKTPIENNKFLFLELHNPQFPSVGFGKTSTHENGEFLLRANPGNYLLSISRVDFTDQKVLLGSIKVQIGSEGVFQGTILVD